jgi:hypothetical protein
MRPKLLLTQNQSKAWNSDPNMQGILHIETNIFDNPFVANVQVRSETYKKKYLGCS